MRVLSFFVLPMVFMFGAACRGGGVNSAARPQVTNSNQTAPVNQGDAVSTTGNNVLPTMTYEIVQTYKHDPRAFTQGLVFHNGDLYESTGQYGESTLRRVDLEDGGVEKKRELNRQYFAEGITILNDKIYQITWQQKTCFVYDLKSFDQIGQMSYNGEGWGLTNDGTNLIMSDGSHQLKFIDPTNFRVLRTVSVLNEGKPLYQLNELEYVNGEIYANIWHSEDTQTGGLPNIGKPNHIARINPQSGRVTGWIDLADISPEDVDRDEENTLNGIAYDQANDRLFVTGKRWSKLFEIKLRPKSS